jgi:hypothetical protein
MKRGNTRFWSALLDREIRSVDLGFADLLPRHEGASFAGKVLKQKTITNFTGRPV